MTYPSVYVPVKPLDSLQLLPIKLVSGFIAIDFVSGCVGCNFCVARRNPEIASVFNTGGIRTLGLSADQVFAALNELPSFTQAKVPLRIGNDTDFAFQRSQTRRLIDLLPKTYPVVVLTRFPVENADTRYFEKDKQNVLLKVTLTPRSNYLTQTADPYVVLNSIKQISGELLITIGPIVADNIAEATSLISAIPNGPNISVYLKRLDKAGLPLTTDIPEVQEPCFDLLKAEVLRRKIRLNSFMLCLLFKNFGREDPRSGDIPKDEIHHCINCASKPLCWNDRPLPVGDIKEVAAKLGLNVLSIKHVCFRTYYLDVDQQTAYGDEAYFSFMLGRKVRLSGTAEGTAQKNVLASPAVLRRWSEVGFFLPNRLLKRV